MNIQNLQDISDACSSGKPECGLEHHCLASYPSSYFLVAYLDFVLYSYPIYVADPFARRTEYEQCQHCAEKGDPKPFVVPEDGKDWLNPSGDPHVPVGEGEFRERATVLAHRTVWPNTERTRYPDHVQNIVMQGKRESSLATDLDALSIGEFRRPSIAKSILIGRQ